MSAPARACTWAVVGSSLLAFVSASAVENGTADGEWSTYGGDLANTKYAPLNQIDADNFDDLEIAWRFKTDALGPTPEYNLQATPLMVGGVIFIGVVIASLGSASLRKLYFPAVAPAAVGASAAD